MGETKQQAQNRRWLQVSPLPHGLLQETREALSPCCLEPLLQKHLLYILVPDGSSRWNGPDSPAPAAEPEGK